MAVAFLAALAIAACASDTGYTNANKVLATGDTPQGLAQLEQAAREHPRDQKLRFEWLRQRELAVSRLIAQAETARASGRLDEARSFYQQALQIDPDHPRARAGDALIAADRRHALQVQDAEGLFGQKNYADAETRLRAVLSEDPAHPDARNLLRRVIEASQSITPPLLKSAVGKKVTLEFKEANLRSVFEVVGRSTGLNFVFDKDVRQDLRTTIVVRNSTVEDAIKLVLITNQLERKVLNDNTVLIYPNTPAKLKEYQELAVRSFYIANADVKQVLNLIRTVVKTRDVYIDEKLNLLVMKDTPDAIRLAEKLIATQDLADPEVTLEVEVLEVSSNRLQELGARFPDHVQFQSPETAFTGVSTLMRASGPLVGFVATPAFVLNLRQQDGYANVLANPRIRVKNREKARVHIGDRVPVVTTTSTANVGVSASVSYLDVGLKLEVEPTIHLGGDVAIKVGLEVSNIVREVPITGGGIAYRVGTRNAATVLRLRDGETQVLAGLIQDEERSTANRVPGVGELPVLGRLFSSNLDTRDKTEIVLLMTPRIVRNLTRGDQVRTEFYSGTEAAVGAAPLTLSATEPVGIMASGMPGKASNVSTPAPVDRRGPPVPPPAITLAVPPAAKLGSEFTVGVMLLSQGRPGNTELDLIYDPGVLAPVAGDAANGRIAVKLAPSGAGPARYDIRFRVIASVPGTTQLRAENIVVQDPVRGNVSMAPPPAQTLQLAP